ncbi:MAG: TRAP transporter large permease subunit [Pseudomonadota bacterium]
MEWWVILPLIFSALIILMISGVPVAFCFMAINIVCVYLFWGGQAGLWQLVISMYSGIGHFSLVTLLLFLLMGEVMLQSKLGFDVIEVIDMWLGRLPGRLGLVAIASGTLLASLTGASMATIALMGSALTPEMERRGYKKAMSLGPILGSSGLAKMIPPSGIAVVLAVLANLSVAQMLIAIIVPGLIMALFYAIYTVVRCWLQPSIAPSYPLTPIPLSRKLFLAAKYILPLGLVIFLVTGVILLGIATPTEAGATGALGSIVLAACHGRLSWEMLKKSFIRTLEVSVMVLMIIAGSKAFSQILAFSGATRGLISLAVDFALPPVAIIIAMMVFALLLGCFMEVISVLMISVPIYVPIITALGYDPLWFGVVLLLNAEMGPTTPPFGLSMFVMKGVAPPDTTMGDIYKAGIPYLGCDATVLALMIAFPIIPLWLPGLMS